jgi:hypothetical protein
MKKRNVSKRRAKKWHLVLEVSRRMEGVELVGAGHGHDQEVAVLLGAAELVLLHLARRPVLSERVQSR